MILKYLTMSVIGAIGFGAAWVAGWAGAQLADRDIPYVVTGIEIQTPKVQPGGELVIEYSVNRIRPCAVHSDRVLYDSKKPARNREILDDIDYKIMPGPMGLDSYLSRIKIPEYFVEGPAVLSTATQCVCNTLQKIVPVYCGSRDISFQVVKSAE